MDNPYDAFYKSMENLGAELNGKRKAVQTDKDRSESGRQKALAELEAEYKGQIETLTKRYHDELGKARQGYEKTLNGQPKPPPSALDRLKMKIRKAPAMEFEYLSDDDRAAAIVESNQAVMESLKKLTFMNVAGRLGEKELAAAMDKAFQSGNQSAIENLAEVAAIRGDEIGVKRGQGYIADLKEQSLTPAQKIARLELERLSNHGELFDWGVKEVLAGREFVDLRGRDSDQRIDIQIAQIQSSANKES